MDKLWPEIWRVLKEDGNVVLHAAQPFTWRVCASAPKEFRYEIIWEKTSATAPMLAKVQPLRCHENILVFYRKRGVYNPQMNRGKPYGGFKDESKNLGEVYSGGKSSTTISQHRDNPEGTRYPRSVIVFPKDKKIGEHPTQKPLALNEWIIKTYSNVGDLVLDCTMGVGTSAVACKKTGRRYIGIEKEKKYHEVAKKRLAETVVVKTKNSPDSETTTRAH